MSPEQIVAAEDAIRDLLAPDVARLLHPVLNPQHLALTRILEDLPWAVNPMDAVAETALKILVKATSTNGTNDPARDDSDVPWCMTLSRLATQPAIGSRVARAWFAHLERGLWDGVPTSSVLLGVAAYSVAMFEDALAHDHGAWWLMMASTHCEYDERPGLGLAVVIRAARLLTGAWR